MFANSTMDFSLFGAQWVSCSVCPPKRQKYLWRVIAEYLWWCWSGWPPRQTGKCHQTGCPHRHTRPGHVSQYYILIFRSFYWYFLLLLSILQVLCFLFSISQYKILIIGHQTGYSTTTTDPATSRHVLFLSPYIWHLLHHFFSYHFCVGMWF